MKPTLALLEDYERARRQLLARLAPTGLSIEQYQTLVVLREGPQPVRALGVRTGVHHSATTRMVNRLERDLLVRRERGQTDGRERIVHLTARGHFLVDSVQPKVMLA